MRPALHGDAWPGPGRPGAEAHPRGGPQRAGEMGGLPRARGPGFVSALTWDEDRRLGLTEVAAAAAAGGVEFVSFPIADRGVPRRRTSPATPTWWRWACAGGVAAVQPVVRRIATSRSSRWYITSAD